jgi:hypothetical protein
VKVLEFLAARAEFGICQAAWRFIHLDLLESLPLTKAAIAQRGEAPRKPSCGAKPKNAQPAIKNRLRASQTDQLFRHGIGGY